MYIANRQKRLSKFYGDVASVQNKDIISLITGKRILDIGCGYGNLLHSIKNEKKDVEAIGIDIDPDAIGIAKELYGVDARLKSIYEMDFCDNFFDTVILKETIHHFTPIDKLRLALKEIYRICNKELIIFDPNPVWILRLCRRFIKHQDPQAPLDFVIEALKKSGFEVKSYNWRDVVAFPLSGGFVGIELIPNISFIKKAILKLDELFNNILSKLNLQKFFCWRYLIYAAKNEI